jgi:hypothetical protein
VQKRKAQDQAEKAARREKHRLRNSIKRSALRDDATSAGLLYRQLALGRVAEYGRGHVDSGDLGAAVWASGCVDKGYVPFSTRNDRVRRAAPHISQFYVNGDDERTGLGTAYVCEFAI